MAVLPPCGERDALTDWSRCRADFHGGLSARADRRTGA